MNHDKYSEDVKTLAQRNARKNVLIGAMAVAQLLSLMVLTQIVGDSRTVVVPPNIERTFWVTHNRASAEYLEQMAAFSAWLILDVTPASIDWKRQTLLEFADPSAAGDLKTRMALEADRLRKLNASTFFSPRQLVASEEQQTVVISGQLRTQINGENTSAVEKQYVARFMFKGGRMHLKEFKEIENDAKK